MRNFFQWCSITCLKIILTHIYEKDLKKGNSWDLGLLYIQALLWILVMVQDLNVLFSGLGLIGLGFLEHFLLLQP